MSQKIDKRYQLAIIDPATGEKLATKTVRFCTGFFSEIRADLQAFEWQMAMKGKELARDVIYLNGLWDDFRPKPRNPDS